MVWKVSSMYVEQCPSNIVSDVLLRIILCSLQTKRTMTIRHYFLYAKVTHPYKYDLWLLVLFSDMTKVITKFPMESYYFFCLLYNIFWEAVTIQNHNLNLQDDKSCSSSWQHTVYTIFIYLKRFILLLKFINSYNHLI